MTAVTSRGPDRPEGGVAPSLEELRSIEAELNTVPFRGSPLGSALNDFLITELALGRGNSSIQRWWLPGAKELFHRLAGAVVEVEELRPPVERCDLILTWNDPSERFRELARLLVEAFGPKRTAVTVIHRTQAAHLPHGAGALLNDAGRFRPTAAWRREYGGCREGWRAVLEGLREQRLLDRTGVNRLLDALCFESQRFEVWQRWLTKLGPRAVVTLYDRSFRNAPLVLAARTLGIPTVTLVHGVITKEYGYTPVLAQKILCWGELQRDLLVESGTEPQRVVSVGYPWTVTLEGVRRDRERERFGVQSGQRLVLLATNPIRREWKLRLVEVFASALEDDPRCVPVVRLHPAEDVSDYGAVMADHPGVRVLPTEGWPVTAALAAADVVVCHDSGFAVETLLACRPLVLLDAVPLDLGANRDLVPLGIPVARDGAELRRLVLDAAGPGETPSSPAGLRQLFEATGPQAIANIVREVRALILR